MTEKVLEYAIATSAISGSGSATTHSGDVNGRSGAFYGNQNIQSLHIGTTNNYEPTSGPETNLEKKCLRTIFLTDPKVDRERLITQKGQRAKGTCEWIRSHEAYKSWLDSENGVSQLLWLSGGPGKGKTMLSLFLTDELEDIARSPDSSNSTLIYYFCDNKDEKLNNAVAILRGLIFQLLKKQPLLFSQILPTYEIEQDSIVNPSSSETLWKIFRNMVGDSNAGTVYCVLDGLDECQEESLIFLLKKFDMLFRLSGTSTIQLKVLIVSREFPEFIPETLFEYPRIKLDPDSDAEVSHDLQLFIIESLRTLNKKKNYPGLLAEKIESALLAGAEGTFLWVSFVIAELLGKANSEVEMTLESLPKGLGGMYDRMLQQIPNDRKPIVGKILRWVVKSFRPLTVQELSAAIEVVPQPLAGMDSDDIIRENIDFCGCLLRITGNKVSLIHQSLKDYLLQKKPSDVLESFGVVETIDAEISRKCLECIQNAEIYTPKESDLKNIFLLRGNSALFDYTVLYWPQHLKNLPASAFDLSLPFFQDKNFKLRNAWWYTYFCTNRTNIIHHIYHVNRVSDVYYFDHFSHTSYIHKFIPYSDSSSVLHFAAYYGILGLCQTLWYSSTTFRSHYQTWLLETPLWFAIKNGHKEVVRFLLDKGAELGDRYMPPYLTGLNKRFITSPLRRHELQLATPEEQNSKGIYWLGRSLYESCEIASIVGHKDVVELLLERKCVDIVHSGIGVVLLNSAIFTGQIDIVQLLLDHGAHKNGKYEKLSGMRNFVYNIPLIIAIDKGYKDIVKLLLEHGADANVCGTKFLRYGCDLKLAAVHAACIKGDITIIRLLLDHGADVNSRNKSLETSTPLHIAINKGHKAIVELLLKRGADVNAKNLLGRTPLLHCRMEGSKNSTEISQLLLKHGAVGEVWNSTGRVSVDEWVFGLPDNEYCTEPDNEYCTEPDTSDGYAIKASKKWFKFGKRPR